MSTDPVAASTAGDVKFSDAISCRVEIWRSYSSATRPATSGSASNQGPKGVPALIGIRTRRRSLRREASHPWSECTHDPGAHLGRRYACAPVALDPRTPVLVGVGQVTVHPGEEPEPPEPLALMVRSVEAALADAGGRRERVLGALGSVRVVRSLQWDVPDPGALVAQRVGFSPAESVHGAIGGNTPQALVADAAAAIQAGRLDAAVVVGAECGASRAGPAGPVSG